MAIQRDVVKMYLWGFMASASTAVRVNKLLNVPDDETLKMVEELLNHIADRAVADLEAGRTLKEVEANMKVELDAKEAAHRAKIGLPPIAPPVVRDRQAEVRNPLALPDLPKVGRDPNGDLN